MGLLLLSARTAGAQGQPPEFSKLIKTYQDTNAAPPDREKAICAARGLCTNEKDSTKKGPQRDAFKSALDSALRSDLPAKLKAARAKVDKDPTDKDAKDALKAFESLVERSFETITFAFPNQNYADLGLILKPFLSDPSAGVRTAALTALQGTTGAKNLKDDLIAIYSEPQTTPKEKSAHQRIETLVVTAARGLPADEALEVLNAAINTKGREATDSWNACTEIADMILRRPARELNSKRAHDILLEATKGMSSGKLRDAASVALWRVGSWDGVPSMLERLDGRQASEDDYTYLCRIALHDGGFNGVAPTHFMEAQPDARAEAMKNAHQWFDSVRSKTTEQVVFDALAVALKSTKVNVPKSNFDSREGVTALIEGMDVNDKSLRYAALDLFVKKTASLAFGVQFKTLMVGQLKSKTAYQLFPELELEWYKDDKAQQLKDQQSEKVVKVRAWWAKVQDKASFAGGVCSESYEPEKLTLTKG